MLHDLSLQDSHDHIIKLKKIKSQMKFSQKGTRGWGDHFSPLITTNIIYILSIDQEQNIYIPDTQAL